MKSHRRYGDFPQCISVSCVLKLLVKSSIEIAQMCIHLRHKPYVLRHILLWLPKLWPSQGQTIDAFTWQFSESRWKISTAWSAEMLNACCQPVTDGHAWHLIFVSLLFYHGERHVLHTFVLQAVVWSMYDICVCTISEIFWAINTESRSSKLRSNSDSYLSSLCLE